MNILRTKSNWMYLIALSAFTYGCSAQGQGDSPDKVIPELPVTKLITVDTVLHNDYVADIQAVKHVEVRARVNGFLEKIYVDEGQEVKKGQPLFRISSEEYKAEVARADANLKNVISEALAAELDLDRVKLLVEKKVISKSELDLAKAKLKAAMAKIDEAQSAKANAATRLSYTYIRAPFSGIMDRIPLKEGSLVEEGTLLTTVSDLEAVYAYFDVSEKEYLAIKKAKQTNAVNNSEAVKLILADGTLYPHEGEIETMEGVFEANTGSIAFRARFPNPKQLLKHHSTGKVRLFNDIDNALMVPQKATFEVQDKSFVYVVDSLNKVTIKSFHPKARFSHFYIVGSGLEPGEKVVYEGIQNLREGVSIRPDELPMDSLFVSASL
ncbi:efflux RND transporter periplasmic adaptor subunit [Botryobacter ruber]|uniref:efflux RND transporter periplasmic adaptor subunit n=1 Tax=Botryobacter ruber TaxID=2171629 RepID=UPI001F0BA72A|nr:efflux RND transporter periplasmic adaptor subunit [Botryobacter ruber]